MGLDGGDQCSTFTGALCLTASLAVNGGGVVCGPGGTSEICAPGLNPIDPYEVEGLGNGNTGNYTEATCYDGIDNDCDGDADVSDLACQAAEICDGFDNDGDLLIDETFSVGALCTVGVGECARNSTYACLEDGSGVYCGANPGPEKKEGIAFGNSCDDGKDNDCDGLTDLFDDDCTGFGQAELCGNGLDDDGDGVVDEGFPQIGLQCSAGVGACTTIGSLVCNFGIDGGIGDGVVCNATGHRHRQRVVEGTCNDFIDNDCDGFTDAADTDCGAAFADLGVTCSLPYTHAKPGGDCTGKHTVTFGAEAEGVTLKADLLALDVDGTLLDVIEFVEDGEEAHLASRLDPDDFRVDSKSNKKGTRHTVYAPMPVLRVTGTSGTVEDVAYCSIMPWLDVTAPDNQTISLNESTTLDVAGHLPLVDVDTLALSINGIDILYELGIIPYDDFPTNGGVLVPVAGRLRLPDRSRLR